MNIMGTSKFLVNKVFEYLNIFVLCFCSYTACGEKQNFGDCSSIIFIIKVLNAELWN